MNTLTPLQRPDNTHVEGEAIAPVYAQLQRLDFPTGVLRLL